MQVLITEWSFISKLNDAVKKLLRMSYWLPMALKIERSWKGAYIVQDSDSRDFESIRVKMRITAARKNASWKSSWIAVEKQGWWQLRSGRGSNTILNWSQRDFASIGEKKKTL